MVVKKPFISYVFPIFFLTKLKIKGIVKWPFHIFVIFVSKQSLLNSTLHSKANALYRHLFYILYANAGRKKPKHLHIEFIAISHNSVKLVILLNIIMYVRIIKIE